MPKLTYLGPKWAYTDDTGREVSGLSRADVAALLREAGLSHADADREIAAAKLATLRTEQTK